MHYSEADKVRVLALYLEVGVGAASRETGVPARTIQRWAGAAGLRPTPPRARLPELPAPPADEPVGWEDRRQQLADDFADLATQVTAQLRTLLTDGPGNHATLARNLAEIAATLADAADRLRRPPDEHQDEPIPS